MSRIRRASPVVWPVVVEDGSVVDVRVELSENIDGMWVATCGDAEDEACASALSGSPRAAVVAACADLGLAVRQVLAPGELTVAETWRSRRVRARSRSSDKIAAAKPRTASDPMGPWVRRGTVARSPEAPASALRDAMLERRPLATATLSWRQLRQNRSQYIAYDPVISSKPMWGRAPPQGAAG